LAPVTLTEQVKIVASDGNALDDFGASVAMSGDTAVIGAPMDDFPTGGSIYIFLRNGTSWSEQVKILGPLNAQFGSSVAMSGDTIVVGAPRDDGVGSAYVYVRSGSGWLQQAKLAPSSASLLAGFGRFVAIDGETVLVGSPNDQDGSAMDVGSAFVFVRSGTSWSEQAKLRASDGAQADLFGLAVALSGDSAAVGAFGRQGFRGAVYIFVRNGTSWSEQAQLLPDDAAEQDVFSASVAISGDTVAVGAPGVWDPGTGEQTGAAYVFQRAGSSWAQQAELVASDSGGLGASVALSGDTLIAGDPWNASYLFLRDPTGWYERAELVPSDSERGFSSFGNAVALSGTTVLVGAMVISTPDYHQLVGAVYVYPLSFSPGFVVNPTERLVTSEWGGTAQLSVGLNSQPAGEVVIDLASSDPGEGSVSPAQLAFTPQSWLAPQTVTLTGVDDFVQDGNQPYAAVLSVNAGLTADPVYAQMDPPDVPAVNLGLEGDFYTITPCRVLDTRQPSQGPGLSSGVKRLVQIHDLCGIPTTAGALALNLTVVGPTREGTLRLYPGDLAAPSSSTLTFKAGQALSGNAIVLLATDNTGTLAVWPSLGMDGSSHLVIDVSGYFE